MSATLLSVQSVTQNSGNRWGLKPSWRVAALVGIPIVAMGTVGLTCYLLRKRSKTLPKEDTDIPATPLEAAVALKNRGNKYFKAGQYAKAIQLYEEGLDHCPLDAVTERAALFQNRAAAKENLRQYESAIVDCTSALELSPKYLKALNRRAHIYEKLEMWEECLPDVVACCIFEEFKNADNIIRMDQALKKVGQKKAHEEWDKLPHSLPSNAFIRNYMSAFAWNPFAKIDKVSAKNSPEKNNVAASNGTNEPGNPPESTIRTEVPDKQHEPVLPEQFRKAYDALDQALDGLNKGDYENSMQYACKAVALFEAALANPVAVVTVKPTADGDEVKENSGKSAVPTAAASEESPAGSPEIPLVNGHTDKGSADGVNLTVSAVANTSEMDASTIPTTEPGIKSIDAEQLRLARANYCRALLLNATYLALAGRAADARRLFQIITAEDSGAETIVRVNALIKSACLSMSVDQDFAACLYDFQNAQSACPECPDVYLHRGQINLLADQLDEALHDLNTAVKLKPEFSIAQAQRLYTLYRRALNESNPDRATARVEDFRKLSQKYPNCLETHSLFAQILTERGDLSASDEEFAKVIELAPDSGLAYAHRGLLQLRWMQDRDAAHKWFTLGAKADPKCELIHELLGQLAVERGQFAIALKHFDAAIREAKTLNDLAHLIALREGVQAQSRVCEKYNISITDVMATLKREQQQMMMGMS